jgi:signal transduction histidine kinase
MSPLSRLAGYLVLLLCFIVSVLAAQSWLRRQTLRLNADAIETRRQQFRLAANILKPDERSSRDGYHQVGELIGARVQLLSEPVPAPESSATVLTFDERVVDGNGLPRLARVSFATPATAKFMTAYHRVTLGLILLGVVLFAAGAFLAVFDRRNPAGGRGTTPPWAKERAQAIGMEHFARISHERAAELARETDARRRVEEDLQVSRTMLDTSQEERARLGRELHDNICQTLYAVSLTLESIEKKVTAPPETVQRLGQCIAELRRLNQEVRRYLQGLEPVEIRRQTFAEAVAHMLALLPAAEGVQVHNQFDAEAVALISPQQTFEVVNILREAVSNALRHGQAKNILLRAERGEAMVALAVQDDGQGFTPDGDRKNRGHGLTNMEARATALSGSLRVDSTPGKGTRVLLMVPVVSDVSA